MEKIVQGPVVPSATDNTSIGRILLLVTYLFVGSLLALVAAGSVWAVSLA